MLESGVYYSTDADAIFPSCDYGECETSFCSVVAVFGSSSAAVDASVAGVCDALHVPYISTLTKTTESGGGGGGGGGGLVARIGPSSRHISMAVRDLVGDMSWRDVAVVVHRQSGNCNDDALANF